jgi:hypothetical protein
MARLFSVTPTTSTVSKYGIALLAIAAAVLARAALTPWMGQSFPLATAFTAVAFIVWYGGAGPALFTSVGCYVAATMLFPQRFAQLLANPLTFTELLNFSV